MSSKSNSDVEPRNSDSYGAMGTAAGLPLSAAALAAACFRAAFFSVISWSSCSSAALPVRAAAFLGVSCRCLQRPEEQTRTKWIHGEGAAGSLLPCRFGTCCAYSKPPSQHVEPRRTHSRHLGDVDSRLLPAAWCWQLLTMPGCCVYTGRSPDPRKSLFPTSLFPQAGCSHLGCFTGWSHYRKSTSMHEGPRKSSRLLTHT